jgi:hypothetical protein
VSKEFKVTILALLLLVICIGTNFLSLLLMLLWYGILIPLHLLNQFASLLGF